MSSAHSTAIELPKEQPAHGRCRIICAFPLPVVLVEGQAGRIDDIQGAIQSKASSARQQALVISAGLVAHLHLDIHTTFSKPPPPLSGQSTLKPKISYAASGEFVKYGIRQATQTPNTAMPK